MLREGLGTRLRVEQTLMIAPLLDIMFLVLLFFILNTDNGGLESFDVDIPQVHQSENSQPITKIVVTLTAHNEYMVNDKVVEEENLFLELQYLMKNLKTNQVLLLASKQIDYGSIISTMEFIKRAGATGVSLGVEQLD